MARTDNVCDPAAPAQLASPAASAARWPNHSILELGALPSAVPCVRLHTTLVLREWHLTGLADAAELVASELATNAVQASSTSQRPGASQAGLAVVRLHLASDRRQVLIEVGDNDPRPPAPIGPAELIGHLADDRHQVHSLGLDRNATSEAHPGEVEKLLNHGGHALGAAQDSG